MPFPSFIIKLAFAISLFFASAPLALAFADALGKSVYAPELVKEVLAGRREAANAAWWGFEADHFTKALQEAVKSKAKRIVVPNMGRPWIVDRTIFLESNQEIFFERGVQLFAKPGSFRGKVNSLLEAVNKRNISIRGNGATLLMRKKDYLGPPYVRSEWRHCLALRGCQQIQIYDLKLADSGGDGIYIGRGIGKDGLPYCQDLIVKDVVCENHYRNGITVISARNLRIEDSEIRNTRGTRPETGIDFEPNEPDEILSDCRIQNCLIEENAGHGILIYLKQLSPASLPISLSIAGSRIERNRGEAIRVSKTGALNSASVLVLRNNQIHGKQMIEYSGMTILRN